MPNRNPNPNHLTALPDGRFCKRVRGVLHYFGRGGDRDAALAEWLAVKADLLAGRPIRRAQADTPAGTPTVKFVNDSFLSDCTAKVDAGRMKGGTFDDYFRACEEFGAAAGWGTDPDALRPDDFRAVRAKWAERMGPWSLDRYVQAVRTMFNFAVKHRLILREPFYGDAFRKSTEADKRGKARDKSRERGERVFTPAELRFILDNAEGPLRAMVLLALNGGMYARDVAALREGDIRREGRLWVVDFAREKTGGVPWKFPLWPETRAAIDAALAQRPKARDAADGDLVFVTIHGRRWVREHTRREGPKIKASASVDAVAQEFDKLLGARKRPGLGFGTLRHTHVTAVGGHADLSAARRVRGHKMPGIEAHYDKVQLFRLKSVTDLARSRLLPASRRSRSGRRKAG
jgi:integrase